MNIKKRQKKISKITKKIIKKRKKEKSEIKKIAKKNIKSNKKKVVETKKLLKITKLSPEEHVKHISYDYEGRKKQLEVYDIKPEIKEITKRPLGVKVLLTYLFIILFFYITYIIIGLKSPIAVVVGQIIEGVGAIIFTISTTIILFFIIYSIIKRKKWGYYLSIAWFVFGILNAVLSLILLSEEISSATRNFLILSSSIILLIDIIAIIYIVSEKQYFFATHLLLKRVRTIDKIFVGLITIFIASLIVISCIIGYDFYKTNVKLADSLIEELKGKTEKQQEDLCNSKTGQERELCLLILSIKSGSLERCKEIKSDFYRFACMRA
ncbi:MAG: hypothetical protein QXG86_02920 [Candidatus Woesearchaeota archaeon]